METSGISCFSPPQQAAPDADAFSQTRLTDHLERLLLDPSFLDRADTEIVLAAAGCGEPVVVGAYSCLLARSPFFRSHIGGRPAGEKLRFELAELVPGGHHIGRDALVSVLGYLYTARPPKVPPQECADKECMHGVCRPAIDFVVQATYVASVFQIHELVSLFQQRLSEIVAIVSDEDIIPIIIVAHECNLPDLRTQCIERIIAFSNLDSTYLEKKIPADIYRSIREFCRRCSFRSEFHTSILDPDHEHTNIHKALDSGNVDLVGMLLKQSTVTLDDAFAIHYAAAHCKPKVLTELLKLDSANVNMRNHGGYTPLHIACMRLEPRIILSLLVQGASVFDRARDGRDALTICKRLTRPEEDVNRELKKGQETSSAYLCINILEQETISAYLCINILEHTKRTLPCDQVSSEETIVRGTPLLVDNFQMRLLFLERRVEFAKLFFPSEAQLAMHIAEADSTEEFDTIRFKEIDLKTPGMHRRWRERFDALTKTVDLGRRYFPNCSYVLDNFINEESALTILGSGTPEDKVRMRYYKLREDVQKAFSKDKAAGAGAAVASKTSSSSSSRLESLISDSSPSRAVYAIDSTDAPGQSSSTSRQGHNAGAVSGQRELQSANVALDDDAGVGSKRKLRSSVWDEFKRIKLGDDWFAICIWCHNQLKACTKNGTNHLHRHLKFCRSRQVTKGLNQSTLKLSQNPYDSAVTLEKIDFDQEVARKELALMIITHEYPLSMVEHPGFRKFCAAMNPMFMEVSRNTIMKYILDMYEVKKRSMVKHFKQCQARIAVTTEIWTADNRKKGYMAVTAHYIDDHWKLNSYLLRFIYVPESYTGEVMSDVLHEVLMEWHIERKLSTVTLDNCTASDNLMENMVHKLPPSSLMLDGSLVHMRSVAHTLYLIVQDGMSLLDERIEGVRENVAFWVATPERHQKFEEVASQMNIKYQKRITGDCKTRWDSTYAMLSTALEYRKVFIYLSECEKLLSPSCPGSADWNFARELCDRLKMFFDIADLLSGTTYVTANLLFPKICGIYLAIRKWQASKDPMIEKMSKLVKERFGKFWLDVHNLMAVAIALDPRYKLHLLTAVFTKIYGKEGACVKVAEVSKLLCNLVLQYKQSTECDATTCGAPSTSAFKNEGNDEVFDLFDEFMSLQVHTELELYLKESTVPRMQELDIINWWQFEGTKYPTLRKLARDVMAISVTTIPSEEVLHTGERIISPHSSRLAPQILEALMCMQAWSRADRLGSDSTTTSPMMTCLDEEEKKMEDAGSR